MATKAEDNPVGKTIFSRHDKEEADSDIWDDSALIEAYDKAVSKMKGEVVEEPDADVSRSKQRKKKHNKQRKSKTRTGVHQHWRVGDQCRVEYEDGALYTATIMSLDADTQTCRVQYNDYEETQDFSLSQLRRVRTRASASESGSVASETPSGGHFHHLPPGGATGHRYHHTPTHSQSGEGKVPPFSFPSAPFPPGPASSSVPFVPPPPPPILGDDVTEESEALCSMLMSWYMSGYHTGYYQGLREGRKQANANQAPYR